MMEQQHGLCQEIEALSGLLTLGQAQVHDRINELSDRFTGVRQAAGAAGLGDVARQCNILANRFTALLADASAGTENWQQIERELRLSLELLKEMVAVTPAAASAPDAESAALESLGQDRELVADFLMESREHLAAVEQQVLRLEQDPRDIDAINSVFRGFHTIKGLAGFLGLTAIRDLTHEVETALDLCRSGRLAVSRAVINVVLESADYLSASLEVVEKVLNGQAEERLPGNAPLIARVKLVAASPAHAGEPGALTEKAVAPAAPSPAQPVTMPPPGRAADKAGHKASAVKVDTTKLDHLVDMVGELVIAQSMLRHEPSLAGLNSPNFTRILSQLGRITDEVQKTAMSMRLVRLEPLFQKMARLVRDTAMKTGKNVELQMAGEETELDRTIVEELADPLLHMIRNAVDHGIELPDARQAAGKSAMACVSLRASYQAGYIEIEIADDGKGLDRERLLAKAVERGLVDAGAKLSDTEVFHLIFAPGFSTAEKVTDLSGRGVGMDVVKKQIQKLRGRVEIESVRGQGTTFTLKLPLTLAIIDGLVVSVGGERYVIPIFAVKEMLRPAPGMLTVVEGQAEMALIRGRLLPIIRLHECFGVKPKYHDPCEALLIVSECEGRPFALMVDELTGKQEVVLKSLGEMMKDVKGLTGCAILGDGRVGMILDVEALFRG